MAIDSATMVNNTDQRSNQFVNTEKPGEQIIIEGPHPNPSSPNNIHGGRYIRRSMNGDVTRTPLAGNPALGGE